MKMTIGFYLRSPGDNELLGMVRENGVNDPCLVYSYLGKEMSLNLGEWVAQYLEDHPGAQIILKIE